MLVTHDKVFKTFLTDVQTARDFLEIHLPENLRQLCDLSTLRLEPDSLLDPEMRSHFTDILYSVDVKDQQGSQPGYVYHLIEHQSTADPMMAFRLMRYSISVMQRHISQGHTRLPLVIPILYYHGETSPYPYSTNWFDLFDHAEVAKSLYNQPFPLVDVTVIPDKEIFAHRRIAILEFVQKYIRKADMLVLAENPAFLLQLAAGDKEQAEVVLYYMLLTGDTVEPDRLLKTLAMGSPEYKEVIMTVAQKLEERALEKGRREGLLEGRNEGRQEGRQEGRNEGRNEGRQEGKLDVVRKLLRSGMPLEALKREVDLSEEEIQQLKH